MRTIIRLICLYAVATWSVFAAIPAHALDFHQEPEIIRTVLFPIRQALLSAEVESTVKSHKFHEGESFKQGDVLVELDDKMIKERVTRAQSGVDEAIASFDFCVKTLERNLALAKKGFSQGDEVLDRSIMDLDVAKARKILQESGLEVAKLDLVNATIRAPFDGRVLRHLVQEHEYIRVSQQLIQIIDDTKLLAAMHLPSMLHNKTAIGDKIKVKIDETDTVYEGSIYEIAGEIDSASRTFDVKILIDNQDKKLVSGMSGVVLLDKSEAPQ